MVSRSRVPYLAAGARKDFDGALLAARAVDVVAAASAGARQPAMQLSNRLVVCTVRRPSSRWQPGQRGSPAQGNPSV